MEKIKQYQKEIITFIVIALLLEFGIFPCLTMANTFANIVGAIALGILVLWVISMLHSYITSESKTSDQKIKEKLESELGPVIDKMAKDVLQKDKKSTSSKSKKTKKNNNTKIK